MRVISLTTDFGWKDYYVAELKASLLKTSTDIQIVDVSHTIESYDIVQAAFFVKAIYNRFPDGSIHVIGVYNHYSPKAEFVVLRKDGHFFIAPNNGVLSLMFDDIKKEDVIAIERDSKDIIDHIAHGVGALCHGLDLESLGQQPTVFQRKMGIQPVITGSQIRATIIHIDHYHNVIINLSRETFQKVRNGRPFSLFYKQTEPIQDISINYNDVHIGETLCLFNTSGYMEIAVNMGQASTMYNLNKDETIQINFH